jgi:uncharacterized membrane protein
MVSRGTEPRSAPRYPRGREEFGRVLAFSDGLFAIAMTLLVVSIAVPTLQHADDVGDMAEALGDLSGNFISFFISFAVIGRYWAAHHQFFAQLRGADGGLIAINLIYLCFVAFLPFPTALLGEYFENPLSIVIYAVNVALISGLEVVEFNHAYRQDLVERSIPPDVYRWGVTASLTPVLFFLLSVPVAFVDTSLAAACWFLTVPFGLYLNHRAPARADELLG